MHATPSPTRRTPFLVLLPFLALVTGCFGAEEPAPSDASAAGVPSDGAGAVSDGEEDAAPGEALDELFADSLHDVAPAAAGTAYIEVDGTRLEFDELSCEHMEAEGGERLSVLATGEDADLGPIELRMTREIGPDLGWNWEDELVQLTLVGGTRDRELNSISMVQHGRERGGSPEWDHGSGPSPLIRAMGEEATATGTIADAPMSQDPLSGDFTAAAHCG
ncbi:hypothetical protein H4W79_002093 [Nocardiopsis terrae]|uniref:Lipoprotein n=1 Tax=Nocardiopsis terrae TaxID=372655 RepID=A0ABR9HFR9_9ACTN|nr:hypothetical protein [Nocardiopsis terrae]MBE1457879.1 hypothetical protein [Nocardiopsis terrae]